MKTKVLFYCTQAKPYLSKYNDDEKDVYYTNNKRALIDEILNGKIVCECEVECEEIRYYPFEAPEHPRGYQIAYDTESIDWFDLTEFSCLSRDELFDYFGRNKGFALHISNLKVFDKPLELSNVYYKRCNLKVGGNGFEVITKAPQNMMWVWYNGTRYCLISIRPEWLCKILNGEKTIEVRKKILKGMM